MGNYALKVEGLGKQYRIGSNEGKRTYKSIRDVIAQTVSWPIRTASNIIRGEGSHYAGKERFWALQDVSFELEPGEVLGVIGRNGAGKSTLLKLLTRITEPTTGEIRLRGRVGSLLEVGTGFHPELTGRENVYLNGAVLGMKRHEISRKFDEIVDFAEVERFIDTPVKRYSSGMYLRLAFAVAAHLEPEILLVDEVLAVGDAAFQKKCLGKMSDVASQGRTIIFVSHDMGAVQTLTTRCIYLEKGNVFRDGSTGQVVKFYLQNSAANSRLLTDNKSIDIYRQKTVDDAPMRFKDIWIEARLNESGNLSSGNEFVIHIQIEVYNRISGANLTVSVKNSFGQRVAILFSWDQGFELNLQPGIHTVALTIKGMPLSPDQYFGEFGLNRSTKTAAYDKLLDVPLFRTDIGENVQFWLERPWGVFHWSDVQWRIS